MKTSETYIKLIFALSTLFSNSKCMSRYEDHSLDKQSLELSTLRLDFNPAYIDGLTMNSDVNVTVHSNKTLKLSVDVFDKSIAEVFHITQTEHGLKFMVKGTFLGRTHIDVRYFNEQTQQWEPHSHYKVSVVRPDSVLDRVFLSAVILLMICINVGMGCTVDLKVVFEVLKRPAASIIGFFCQFCIMPLVAYSLVRFLDLQGGVALGLFAAGCAPGGGASNVYTYLLGGDINLSVTMTLLSTLASFAMIPLWLFTLGTRILNSDQTQIKIPFFNIVSSLLGLLLPIAFGIYLQHRHEKLSKKITKCLKPIFGFFILFMVSFGIYTNLYIIYVISIPVVAGACLMPYIGFLSGGCLASLARQPRARIIAIALETGIQNTGIPIILLKYSLGQPEADLSVVSSVVVATMTPIPLWIILGIMECRRYFDPRGRGDSISSGVETNCPATRRAYLLAEDSKSSSTTKSPACKTSSCNTSDCKTSDCKTSDCKTSACKAKNKTDKVCEETSVPASTSYDVEQQGMAYTTSPSNSATAPGRDVEKGYTVEEEEEEYEEDDASSCIRRGLLEKKAGALAPVNSTLVPPTTSAAPITTTVPTTPTTVSSTAATTTNDDVATAGRGSVGGSTGGGVGDGETEGTRAVIVSSSRNRSKLNSTDIPMV